MSKIAIISQPDQGVLIDVGGCQTLQEATNHLTSTLQISSEFWKGINVDLSLGALELSAEEVAEVISIAAEVGIKPKQVFADNDRTRLHLQAQNINVSLGAPIGLPNSLAVDGGPSSLSSEDGSGCQDQNLLTAESSEAVTGAQLGSVPAAVVAADIDPAASTADGADESIAGGKLEPVPAPAVLYLRQTLRSGQSVSHKGHLVIIGDVNPGAEVTADGDITVWGALRGIAHAGINGDTNAEIRALRLQPIQIRIAHAIARSPDRPRKSLLSHSGPETARIVNGTIKITANNPE